MVIVVTLAPSADRDAFLLVGGLLESILNQAAVVSPESNSLKAVKS